jgi:hypothetical protein
MRHRWGGLAALVLAAACSGSVASTAPGSDAGSQDGSKSGVGEAGAPQQDGGHPQDAGAESGQPADGSSQGDDGAVAGDAADDVPCGEPGSGCVIAEGFMLATMGPGPSSPATICNLGTAESWLAVGTPAAGEVPSVVESGGTQNGEKVVVTCSVVPVSAGFDVSLQMTTEGLDGGSLSISSPPGLGAVTLAGGGQGITASWKSETFPSATESDCTIAFTYEGQPVPTSPPIAAGRIWGHLSCPQALFNGETVVGPDGGAATIHCDGEADFLFENCVH